jgi:dihydrofolate synthase/folylpolyglutamate synthase
MATRLVPPAESAGLDAWLHYLEQLHPVAIDMGLERVRAVAQRMQLLQPQAQVITVAGTNGKGSTVRYLETMLSAAGYRTGAYISPHLQHYNERVRINRELLAEADHVAAFVAVERARSDISLSYFEFGTLAALWLFQRQPLDVLVLEVGLGGRLDAVNIIDANVAVLTSVGIDHIGFLGSDRSGIAREKVGIFRPQRAAICGEPDLPAEVTAEVLQRGVKLLQVGQHFHYSEHAQHWHWWSETEQLLDLPLPQLPLPNAATAIAALQALALPIPQQAVRDGLLAARESGRLQVIEGPPQQLIDVAHNPHAGKFLATHLVKHYPSRPVYAVMGMLQDKDIAGTLAALSGVVSRWYFADLAGPRGASAKQLAEALTSTGASDQPVACFDSVVAAHNAACTEALQQSNLAPLVLVCGSFYTVGQIPHCV